MLFFIYFTAFKGIYTDSIVEMAKFCVVAYMIFYLNFVNSSELKEDIPATEPTFNNPDQDMMTVNMYKIYEKYSKKDDNQQTANTIRSFRGVPGEY